MRNKRAIYREWCERQTSLPLFLHAWWLDATCGDAWDVALVEKGGEIHAVLPFLAKRSRGFKLISQPMLTPHLGPWLVDTGAKSANDLGRQKDLMNALIDDLPAHDRYQQNWSPRITNWLPFRWRGFSQTTQYTYVLDLQQDHQQIWQGFRENIRREIRRAEKRHGIVVDHDASVEDFLELNRKTFERQGRQPPYPAALVHAINDAARERNCRRIFLARDADGRAHASAFIIWDSETAYYLMGGADPELRNSGAMSVCMWEAIRFASTVSRRFDFEGSMVESIERFFRAFGASQSAYFHVTRTPSPILRAVLAFTNSLGRT